ncbi:MAG: phosphatase PAP2/dual specificity phosphatase family protein [Beijerinckiaceae bacterium]|nr:phosphatase PAP2/dual specificity phosphatase family protein [Beijerinckiaceae bacterium]MCZ8301499.1 phosphatase PAP2/dual specificity phosphatase family protein [Beijerinckiaceae bacterium]
MNSPIPHPMNPVTQPQPAEARPIARAFAYLAGLGAFFYASYGFANWVSSLRADVPAIVFGWERAVPFLAWTIVPYWTTNLFYATSLLFTRTRRELDVHARRLLTAQVIAVTFFLIAPLKFSWPKPDTSGLFGFFFEALGAFDKPFNQAPSLHVALTVILIARFSRLLPQRWFALFLGWSVLVVASVMTTFQHHFIDIPTGALLGLACLWFWRDDGTTAIDAMRLTDDPRRRRLALLYSFGAIACSLPAISLGGWALWLFWPALSLAMVALAYLLLGPATFMKDETGAIAWPARLLLAPYLGMAWLNSRLWTRNDRSAPRVADGVHLGRFPAAGEAAEFDAVIDLTAEMSRGQPHAGWLALPMLDLVAPTPHDLRRAAAAIEAAHRESGMVLVCCALGYGRSVAALLVWLVMTGRAPDLATALAQMQIIRPRLALNPAQREAVQQAIHGG